MPDTSFREAALNSRAWPFEEARRLVARFEKTPPEKGYALFETGYGPSGLPHIGTFGEVARTTMVRRAFETISDIPTRLICFSDDMDGLRKVPTNVPNREMMARYAEEKDEIGRVIRNGTPLTSVPDPFEQFPSFGEGNNFRLRSFLDQFGFEYEFASATEYYRSGRFDVVLRTALVELDRICSIVRPTLGEERRRTYNPFLPIVPEYRGEERLQVLHHAVILERDVERGSALFQELDPRTGEPVGKPFEWLVIGGNCKLQWRADWAMRWAALSVDYEMAGKDLIDSVKLSSQICRALGRTPPEGFNYELFLDGEGQKISKSKGNGLSIEEWLTYASPESLQLFMFQKPRSAKRLHWDVIPRAVDEYHQHLRAYPEQSPEQKLGNPAFHIHGATPPASDMEVPFSMLLNLASAASAEDKAVLWGFLNRYAPNANPQNHPGLDAACGHAVRYYQDHVKPTKRYRAPTEAEREALADLRARLDAWEGGADPEELQAIVYATGRAHGYENLRDWFRAIYEVLLGSSQGPRFGGFIALYGVPETVALIDRALDGRLAA